MFVCVCVCVCLSVCLSVCVCVHALMCACASTSCSSNSFDIVHIHLHFGSAARLCSVIKAVLLLMLFGFSLYQICTSLKDVKAFCALGGFVICMSSAQYRSTCVFSFMNACKIPMY